MTELNPDDASPADVEATGDAVPARSDRIPLVGLGGSAGAIPPLQKFFKAMPVDSGMAFVVVMHLAPEHESTLPELLQRCTAMPVCQAEEQQAIEPNKVYVIPPGKILGTLDGHLTLADPKPLARGRHVAVDLFFRTLADTQGPHAAAIVLSGADGDGAIGIKRIKECGGLTVAQDPDEAEHASMPRSAIATGMVDWVLPVAEMPERLRQYFGLEKQLKLPPEDGPPVQPKADARGEQEAAMADVLAFLRSRTGRDFTCYKRATVVRRIGRRMQVNGVDRPAGLPGLPAHPSRRGRRAAAGPADQRDQLLPRPRLLRGAGHAPGRAVQGPRPERRGARLGAGLRDRRGGVFAGDPAGRESAPAGGAADHPDLRHRPGRAGDPVGAGRHLSDHHRGRRLGRAAAALLRARAARLPRAPRAARDGAVRPARPVEGFTVLAARPGVLPQPADLPEPRGAEAGLRHLPFRPGARRSPVPGLLRNHGRRRCAVHGAGQEEPHLRLPRRAARGAAGADGPRHAGARARRAAKAGRPARSWRRTRSILRIRQPEGDAGAARFLGRTALQAAGDAGAALAPGRCRARHPAPVAQRRAAAAVRRWRAQPQPAQGDPPEPAHRVARGALPGRPDQVHGRGRGGAGRIRRQDQRRHHPGRAGDRGRRRPVRGHAQRPAGGRSGTGGVGPA